MVDAVLLDAFNVKLFQIQAGLTYLHVLRNCMLFDFALNYIADQDCNSLLGGAGRGTWSLQATQECGSVWEGAQHPRDRDYFC